MSLFHYILWDVDPSIFNLGVREVRWYGLLWALSFLIGQQIMTWSFSLAGRDKKEAESLTIYMIVATVIGARLGHCLFYEPDYYLQAENFLEIFAVWQGGLASHGAAVGIFVGLYLFTRKYKPRSFFWVVDRVAITVALAGALIRFGNAMNSEIIGKPSDSKQSFAFMENARKLINYPQVLDVSFKKTTHDTAVADFTYPKVQVKVELTNKFANESSVEKYTQNTLLTRIRSIETNRSISDMHHLVLLGSNPIITSKKTQDGWVSSFEAFVVTRHPAQLYEAFSCFILFLILFGIFYKLREDTPEGLLFGIFLIVVFSLRIVWETMKEAQVDFEKGMTLNMGQWLSIPLILFGIYSIVQSFRNKKA
ncbi:MAG: prolipoprotein diacylglyceryl transferase [Cyclobacteriaceae bacterium]